MPTVYEVHSYHINVGAGDCAVHLLVKKQPSKAFPKAVKSDKYGNILRAVLIDGGRSGVFQWQIKPVFDEIVLKYDFEDSDSLVFDSIIVTHWDNDHYGGVMAMIFDGIENKTIDDSTHCPLMRYKDTECLTTMYVPYWDREDSQLIAALAPEKTHPVGTYKTSRNNQDYFGMGVGDKTARFLCLLKGGADHVIGTNFFDHSALNDAYTTIKTVSDLTNTTNRTPFSKFSSLPGLFCVSCDGQVIGVVGASTTEKTPVMDKDSSMRIANESSKVLEDPASGGSHPGRLGIIPENHSPSNQSSIGALVIWANLNKVSHYTAGDAEEDTERLIMDFIESSGVTQVSCMKLSHHGAIYSTPVDMISTYKPEVIICSSGRQYQHPRWEFAFLIDTWIRHLKGTGQEFPDTFLPLAYPYWLIRSGTTFDKTVNTTSSHSGSGAKGYRDQLSPWLAALGDGFLNVTSDYSSGDIQNLIEGKWKTISRVKAENTPFPGSTALDDGSVTLSDDTILYHLLALSYDMTNQVTVQKSYTKTRGGHAPAITSPQAPRTVKNSRGRGQKQRVTSKRSTRVSLKVSTMEAPGRLTRSSYKKLHGISSSTGHQTSEQVIQAARERVHWEDATQLPVLLDSPPATDYFFLSSTASLIAGITANRYHRFSASSAMDNFFQLLRTSSLTLASTPSTTASWVPLADSDEWLYWMQNNGFQATVIKTLALDDINSDTAGLSGFQITLAIQPSATDAPGIHAYPWNMNFSTASIDKNFKTILNGKFDDIFENGVAKRFPVLMVGLDSTGTDAGDCNLSDIINLFDLPYGKNGFVGLAADLTLQLDTSADARGAIWFSPGANYVTDLRLQFVVTQDSIADLQHILDTIFGAGKLVISYPKVIVRKNNSYIYMGAGGAPGDFEFGFNDTSEIIIGATFKVTSGQITYSFSGYIDFQDSSVEFTITFNDSNVKLETIVAVINDLVSKYCHIPLPADKLLDQAATFIDNATNACFRKLAVSIYDDGTEPGSNPSIKSIIVTMEVPMHLGRKDGVTENIVFFMSYAWPSETFRASLYPSIPLNIYTDMEVKLLPDYESFKDLKPVTSNLVENLSLMNLIPGDNMKNAVLPDGIPDILEAVSFTIEPENISFYGEITCAPPTKSTVPSVSIDFVTLAASYGLSGPARGEITISMAAEIKLTARVPVPNIVNQGRKYNIPEATLLVSVDYDSKNKWGITGDVQDLSLGCLYSYIEKNYEESMMDLLERIMLKTLHVQYEHDTNGAANHFTFTGVVSLGSLDLGLTYDYNSASDPLWKFGASLAPNTTANSSLFEVLESVIGSDAISLLPSCANIPIATDGQSKDAVIDLQVVKAKSNHNLLLFSIKFRLGGDLSFSFIQISDASSSNSQNTAPAPPKRVFRLSLQPMPRASGIPLVGDVPQPFDEMDFVWVHDAGTKAGLLRSEVNLLNKELLTDPGEALRFKDLYDPNSTPKPPDTVVLADGSHFIIVSESKVVLDYTFGQKHTSSNPEQSIELADAVPDTASNQATMAPMSKTIGPLAIHNIGMKYDNGILWLLADAVFTLGPIDFSLIGFGIGFDVSKANIHDWNSVAISWSLSGLGLEFNEPPVEIAGEFLRQGSIYKGGLAIGFDPYVFTAVGAYGQTPGPNSFETVFMYGQLDGPLVQLEVIEISGLKIGFGLNSKVVYPDASQIQYFPFTADADQAQTDSQNPLKLLDAFCTATAATGGTQWIVPTPDSYWLAVGLDAVAFEIINVSAIVVFEFNPYVSLGIFAHGVAAIPETATSPQEAFAWIEFGVAATIDFNGGTFTDEGVLLPNSFVLDPSCHLTGGYAGCTWFGSNPYSGQWVYTVGGYHAAYQRPNYFPNPARLGIYWSLGSDISINGEAYFAVTPKVIMGGGCLHAVFSCGNLSAHFDAWADFLICLHPFYFQGDMGVSVGVAFTLDLWICTIHINVDIGASLYLMGPPFRGTVHVDFWVFGFDINFGSGNNNIDPLQFADFLLLLRQVNQQDPSSSASAGPDSALIYGVQTGNVPSKGTIEAKQLAQWFVRAGTFTFRTQTRFACTTASCNKGTDTASSIDASSFTKDSVFSTPMHVSQPITSELSVTITPATKKPWRLTPVMKKVPQAVWGQYSDANDPIAPGSQGNQIDNLLDPSNPTVNLMLGLTLQVPPPSKSNDVLPCFNAIKAMKSDINTTDPTLPKTPAVQSKWLPRLPAAGEVAKQWKAGQAAAQPFVDAWVAALGWDSPSLKGPVPDRLISGYEGFYMEDPCIASID